MSNTVLLVIHLRMAIRLSTTSRARAPILVILVSLHHIYRNNLFPSFLLQSSVDRMMQRGNASLMVGASSWKDQFIDAFTVQAGKCLLS